jgi:hypothetical protein
MRSCDAAKLTGTRLLIPIHPKLKAELAKARSDHLTFITTEYGAPFTVAGFGGSVMLRARPGLPTVHCMVFVRAQRVGLPKPVVVRR